MPWWSPPKQRQRWGETQILPISAWGQIFFDLFYVGGAYNLGNVLKSSNNYGRSILYFCGAGFPVMMMWFDKMHFDACFTTRPGHDPVHRLVEVIQLCCVATALSRIRSVDILSNSCEHTDMFQFSFSLFLNSMITTFRYIEVALFVVGDPAAKVAAKRDIRWRILPTFFFFGAACESGIFLLTENAECISSDRPIWFCLSGWVSWVVVRYCGDVVFSPKEQYWEFSVPINIHFCMHRYGEWFMLMLGESIISLLIVEGDNESFHHAVKFYSGILSVICLAHLHFRSEPRNKDDHALSRNRSSNYLYTILVPLYSAALTAIGASYKMFLYDFEQQTVDYEERRMLGGESGTYYDTQSNNNEYLEKKQQYAADLFSGSMVTVLVCKDLMVVLHHGMHAILDYAERIPKVRLAVLVYLKYSLVVFLGAMSSFQNDPHFMAIFGLGAILFQEALQRAFRSSQRKENSPDVAERDSSEVVKKNDSNDDCSTQLTIGSTDLSFDDDWDYANDIESFRNSKYGLAKFEQEIIRDLRLASILEQKNNEGENMKDQDPPKEASWSEWCRIHNDRTNGSSSDVDYSRMTEI
mmetsp:Transcript_35245/g.38994  ORF Transcript_35245/g.38994 Transcript_35245/m.38994 type:complete len:582 (+) Transcript_35245:26-1771(+)